METILSHFLYGLAWAVFGLTHSLLARPPIKAVLKLYFSAYYRMAYNLVSMVQIALVYGCGTILYKGAVAYERPEEMIMAQLIVLAVGALLLLVALRSYDLLTLGGIRQIFDHRKGISVFDDEPFQCGELHRWVRHPLYSAGFLILWGRVADDFSLMTAIYGSLYLCIGSFFEERSLIRMYGEVYATYKSRVPAFVPYRGRLKIKEPRS